MDNRERLKEIIAVINSQKESTRKLSVNDAKWLVKRAGALQKIIDTWIAIEDHGTQEDALDFYTIVQNIFDREL